MGRKRTGIEHVGGQGFAGAAENLHPQQPPTRGPVGIDSRAQSRSGATEIDHVMLVADGLRYIETPLELWRHPPLAEEPVTHINHFAEDAVRILVQREGYDILRCETGPHTTEDAGIRLAIRAFARSDHGGSLPVTYDGCAARSLRLVSPGFLTRVVRRLRYLALVRQDIGRMLA